MPQSALTASQASSSPTLSVLRDPRGPAWKEQLRPAPNAWPTITSFPENAHTILAATQTQRALRVPWAITSPPHRLGSASNAPQSPTVSPATRLLLLNASSATTVTSLSQQELAPNAARAALAAQAADTALAHQMDTT